MIRQVLSAAFENIHIDEAATIHQARNHLLKTGYDLALLDISLPDGSGIALIPELKSVSPRVYIVMATVFDDDEHLFGALEAGANGYLLKEHPKEELIVQLQQIVDGRPPLSPAIARRILDHFHRQQPNRSTPGAPPTEETIHLTGREQEVLTLVAKGLKRDEVAKMLGIGLYTVADYIKSIYRKLGISSRAEATLEAVRRGLVES
jgi:DNA-binding NarL/FixJ family response regulator